MSRVLLTLMGQYSYTCHLHLYLNRQKVLALDNSSATGVSVYFPLSRYVSCFLLYLQKKIPYLCHLEHHLISDYSWEYCPMLALLTLQKLRVGLCGAGCSRPWYLPSSLCYKLQCSLVNLLFQWGQMFRPGNNHYFIIYSTHAIYMTQQTDALECSATSIRSSILGIFCLRRHLI